MAKYDQKTAERLADAAIKSSRDNKGKVLDAVAYGFALAASEVGRFDTLNRIFREVEPSDRDAIRAYAKNLMAHHGLEEENQSGQKVRKSFFRIKTSEAGVGEFVHNKSYARYREAKEAIAALELDDLKKITLGAERVERGTIAQVFSREKFEDGISRLIKKGLLDGILSQVEADQFNNLIDASRRVSKHEILKSAADKEAELARKLEEARKARLALEGQKAENAGEPTPNKTTEPIAA